MYTDYLVDIWKYILLRILYAMLMVFGILIFGAIAMQKMARLPSYVHEDLRYDA